eukprot:m.267996 g.267996  ORF g.267996 m.267996 type:complete len:710 (+) comp15649_c0_seq1:490-2619(+)
MVITSTFVVVLAAMLALSQAAPSRLNDQVSYYEPLNIKSHQVMRRGAESGFVLHSTPFQVDFEAFDRKFKLDLTVDQDLFAPGFKVQVHGDGEPYEHSLDDRQYYKGTVNGDHGSFCHMRVAEDGTMRGFFNFQGEKYAIDPTSTHFDEEQQFNHVIYRLSDHDYKSDMEPHDQCKTRKFEGSFDEPTEGTNTRSRRAASAYVQGNVVCGLALVVDSKFYTTIGGSDISSTVDIINQRFADVKELYDNNAINIDSDPEAMTLGIANLEIITSTSTDPYNAGQSFNQEGDKFLDHIKTDPNQSARGTRFDDYCLVHVFTNQEFDGGLLGLAWVGSASGIGGVCQDGGLVGGVESFLNTGFSTQTNFGATVPALTSYLVVAHELGHNFGSSHDTDEESSNGQFLMWPVSVDGSGTNNYLFSTQSKNSIKNVVAAKGGCFSDSAEPFCGNNIQEGTEPCDCGLSGSNQCSALDACCAPDCELAAGKSCSPLHSVNGGCCTESCSIITDTNHECRAATECLQAATCTAGGICPDSVAVDDNTQCAETASLFCSSGACSVSVCALWGVQETLDIPDDDAVCLVHCDQGGTTKNTLQMFTDNGSPGALDTNGDPIDYSTTAVNKAPGAICRKTDGFTGVCDENFDCISSSGETLLDNIENFLKNLSFEQVLTWLKRTDYLIPNYGWLCVGFGVLFLLIIICCAISNSCDKKNGIN